jgi:Ser/Thr protein kinase RdoA (MazF antagonist)
MTASPSRAPAPGASIMLEPAPAIDTATAVGILRDHFAIDASVSPLRSERDRNFLALAPDGRRLVLKCPTPPTTPP